MKTLLDGGMPFVVNGCCGNIHPRNPLSPDTTKSYQEMGDILADHAAALLGSLKPVDGPLRREVKHLKIPLRDLDVARVRQSARLLEEHPTPMWLDDAGNGMSWDWVYAISILDLARHKESTSCFDYEVQGVRLGDVMLLALTGEPFVEAQLKMKRISPATYTMIAHMSNGYVGYVPTPEAIQNGGFETNTCHWSKLDAGALDMITDASLAMMQRLFDA